MRNRLINSGGKMQNKRLRLFPIVIIALLLGILLAGCGKQGNRFANQTPIIRITSYEGYDPSNPFTDSTTVTLFQQRIFWHAYDPDGVVTGYAYRILNQDNVPISTAGNSYIDTEGEITPDNVLQRYGSGWVMHYQAGANQSIPLSDPTARRTIWSTNKYALVNFLASTAAGLPDTTISKFEVICVDNRGAISEQSAFRIFRSYSGVPTCYLSTTRGNPNGGEVGTGIRLSFSLFDTDPFIQPTAWYYQFKVQKVLLNTNTVVSEQPTNEWADTRKSYRINEYLLTRKTKYVLSNGDSIDLNITSDYGDQPTQTRVIARVVDLAGIISSPDTIRFRVKEGFHPQTLIHMKRVYALGSNHFIDYVDTTTPEVLPYTIVQNKQIFATPFFRDEEGYYTAVNSSNLKSWIRWGWHGEYGVPLPTGTIQITNDPYDKKVDVLLDANTNKNYFSEITHFDIRLNNAPYNYPPLATSVYTDSDTGKKWLRVPINSSLGQTIVLTNLPVNTPENPYHFFEVRAVDLQDEFDPTPAEFYFKIVAPVTKTQKSGILIIDDEVHNVNFAPEDTVDARYANMLSSYTGEIVVKKRAALPYSDIRNRKIALTDIQKYKLIIYHADQPNAKANFSADQDAYALYLNQGGNMLISAGGNLHQEVQSTIFVGQYTFRTYFGLQFDNATTAAITNNFLASSFFVKAQSLVQEYNDVSLAFDLNFNNPNPEPFYSNGQLIVDDPNERSFVSVLNTRKGLGPVTVIKSFDGSANSGVRPIFSYKSKPVFPQPSNANPHYYCPQNQAEFDNVNGLTVGLRKVTANNRTYLLGFPLSYMTQSSAKQFMTQVLNEVMND